MMHILPEQYGGPSLSSAEQKTPYEWGDKYIQRRAAALRADTDLFPLSGHGEEHLARLKAERPGWFASVREENYFRLFEYFRERFAIFEADCRDFEEYWQAMDTGRDLWAWAEHIEGAHTLHRMKDFENIMHLLFLPLREARETARAMQEKMSALFEAQAAFIRLSKTLAELEDEHKRRYSKQERA